METKIYTERITTLEGLRSAIRVMEVEQKAKELQLKEQFYLTYESLKPVNVIKRTLKDLFSTSNLREDFSGTAVGAAGGFLLRKIIVGSSGSLLRKLVGVALQLGVTNLASHKSETIKTLGQSLFERFFHKKDKKEKKDKKDKKDSD